MREHVMQLGLLLRQKHREAAQSLDGALAPLDLAGRHFGVMLILDRDGSSTHRDLVSLTGGDKAGTARTVGDLEGLGIVGREVDARDRRVVHLMLTLHGREMFATAQRRAARVAEELSADLDDDELVQLLTLLRRLGTRPDL